MKGVTKDMDMALRDKIDADVAFNVLKDRMQRMEKHQLAAKEHLKMYLKLAQEHICHAAVPLYTRIKALRQQVEEQKGQLDQKDEIIIHKDKIRV